MDGLSDGELIALYKAGDADAFGRIYERYKKTINRVARSYFLVGGDTDDLAQEGLLGLLRATDTYDSSQGASFKTYATICIVSKIKTAIRLSNSKGDMPLNGATDIDSESVPYPDPETLVIGEEGKREFFEKIKKTLSAFEFEVLNSYLDGLNYKEISLKTGETEKSVDNALQRAKRKIKRS